MKLVAVYFRPGVVVHPGGTHAAMTCWRIEKHTDIPCEEQKNGDVWITTKDQRRVVLRPWAVDRCDYAEAPVVRPEVVAVKR